jgi:nicotinic acid mononucleotide adenylyltransferase
LAGKFDVLRFEEMDVSSTDVRERLGRGESIEGLVPPAVERLILDEGFYDAGIQHRARG